jgi:hypothetical protein
MAVPLFVRRWLRAAGLLGAAQSLKQAVAGAPEWHDFKPADPRSQVSTLVCFEWLRERGLLAGTDYYEFGIFRGFNLWFVQALARVHAIGDMRCVGFDSFFGLPKAEGTFKEGEFSAYRQEVESYLNRYGVDWQRTLLVEGFFDQSLNEQTAARLGPRQCVLCVVDCDLYISTVPVLEFAGPRLGPVSIVYFDDWNDFGGAPLEGEPKAFAEFMARHDSEFTAEPLTDLVALGGKGRAFVLRRQAMARA